jgi:hypothetical protein
LGELADAALAKLVPSMSFGIEVVPGSSSTVSHHCF